MRATGVQPVREEAKAAPPQRPRAVLWGALALVGVAAVGGYFAWARSARVDGEGGLAPLSTSALQAALAARHVDPGELEQLLASDPSIERFARAAAGSQATPIAKAEALTRAIRARASALAFVPWSLAEPRSTPIGVARQVLATVAKDKARAELYPLEVVALEVAALRSLDVPALVAEVASVEGERAPLDPSGYLGYFAVAVYPDEPGRGAPRLFDPYGGRTLGANVKHTVLEDPQALGAALAVRALHEVSYLADPKRALESSSHGLALAAALPSVRTVRGMVVLAGGMVEQGLQEFAAARQLRADPPRLHNVATAELMTGDLERATHELEDALARAPDFASVHATLGTVALMRGEPEQARAQLDEAERLAPDLSLVQWARAELLLRSGEEERGLAVARHALHARPSFDGRLRMGVLLRQAGRYDDLRKESEALLAMAPPYRKSEVRELLQRALGPAALDGEAAEGAAGEGEAGGPKLELGSGSPALTQPAPTLEPPALVSPETPSGPKLHLRDQDERLKLKLR